MRRQNIPLVVIAGPTGVGKTALSIKIAKEFSAEIINGDSLQIYRHLNIGTGKITQQEMEGIPHYLLDCQEVWQDYDASQFKDEASLLIEEIYRRGKLPMIVGGTGLYLEGLLYNLEFGFSESQDLSVRQRITAEAEKMGPKAIWQKLATIDPKAAEKIPYQNVRRTIRALEVFEVSGELFSNQTKHQTKESTFNEVLFVLNRPREELYERINQRVLQMLELGLEQEARWLFDQAQGQNWQSIKGIGYKEWWPYFQEKQTISETVANIQQNSRRYAKRQLTWYRNRMKHPIWIDMSSESVAYHKVSEEIRRHLNKSKEAEKND